MTQQIYTITESQRLEIITALDNVIKNPRALREIANFFEIHLPQIQNSVKADLESKEDLKKDQNKI